MKPKIEKVLRKAMNELELDKVRFENRPAYPNSYNYPPPGKRYTSYLLERKPSGRILLYEQEMVSRDKRPHGNAVSVARGIPAIKDAAAEQKDTIRKHKQAIEACGYTPRNTPA